MVHHNHPPNKHDEKAKSITKLIFLNILPLIFAFVAIIMAGYAISQKSSTNNNTVVISGQETVITNILSNTIVSEEITSTKLILSELSGQPSSSSSDEIDSHSLNPITVKDDLALGLNSLSAFCQFANAIAVPMGSKILTPGFCG